MEDNKTTGIFGNQSTGQNTNTGQGNPVQQQPNKTETFSFANLENTTKTPTTKQETQQTTTNTTMKTVENKIVNQPEIKTNIPQPNNTPINNNPKKEIKVKEKNVEEKIEVPSSNDLFADIPEPKKIENQEVVKKVIKEKVKKTENNGENKKTETKIDIKTNNTVNQIQTTPAPTTQQTTANITTNTTQAKTTTFSNPNTPQNETQNLQTQVPQQQGQQTTVNLDDMIKSFKGNENTITTKTIQPQKLNQGTQNTEINLNNLSLKKNIQNHDQNSIENSNPLATIATISTPKTTQKIQKQDLQKNSQQPQNSNSQQSTKTLGVVMSMLGFIVLVGASAFVAHTMYPEEAKSVLAMIGLTETKNIRQTEIQHAAATEENTETPLVNTENIEIENKIEEEKKNNKTDNTENSENTLEENYENNMKDFPEETTEKNTITTGTTTNFWTGFENKIEDETDIKTENTTEETQKQGINTEINIETETGENQGFEELPAIIPEQDENADENTTEESINTTENQNEENTRNNTQNTVDSTTEENTAEETEEQEWALTPFQDMETFIDGTNQYQKETIEKMELYKAQGEKFVIEGAEKNETILIKYGNYMIKKSDYVINKIKEENKVDSILIDKYIQQFNRYIEKANQQGSI